MEDFGPAEREKLLRRFGRRFAAGDVIFREGEAGNEAFLLQEGRVRLIKRVRAVERSLMVLRAGELFGESAFIHGALRSSTAIALSDAVALALDRAALQDLVDDNRSVSSSVVEQLVRRLRDAEDQIEIMMLRDGQSKIVSALLKLAQRAKTEDRAGALLLISPMELSARVGMDVETVKRGVQKLREGKYVRVVDEQVEIPDVDSLRRLFQLLGVKDEIQGSEAPQPERGKGARRSAR